MEWSDADLSAFVEEQFRPTEVQEVLTLLKSYGEKPYHREQQRVRRVIAQNSRGSLDRLRLLVDVAKIDYRDVLLGDRGEERPSGAWHPGS